MDRIKEKLKALLKDGEIKGVLGFVPSSTPLKNRVIYTESPEDIDKFVVSPFNTLNPLSYLLRLKEKGKVACFLRPCEQRGLNVLVSEGILKRENVFVIDVPCSGAVDPFRLKKAYDGDIKEAKVRDDRIVIKGTIGEKTYPLSEFIPYSCRVCEVSSFGDIDLSIEGEKSTMEHENYRKIEEFDKKNTL